MRATDWRRQQRRKSRLLVGQVEPHPVGSTTYGRSRTQLPLLTAGVSADADTAGELDWVVSVDSTINRAHQHAAGAAG